jgi:prephenate dehydrogenase
LAAEVAGFVRRSSSIAECLQVGAVDHATEDLASAVHQADLVVLCTPIGQMADLALRMRSALKPGAIVTDVGSVKGSVVSALEPLIAAAGGRFVGSHPMAGAERMGVGAARADLYDGAVCVVTPSAQTDPEAQRRVESLWRALGSRILVVSPEQHDDLVSRSSHLVQLVAAQLVNSVLAPARPPEQALLCGGGFRDATRIASGSPEMWRDIALANRDSLGRALDELIGQLRSARGLVEAGNDHALFEFFARAKQRRDAWMLTNTSPE